MLCFGRWSAAPRVRCQGRASIPVIDTRNCEPCLAVPDRRAPGVLNFDICPVGSDGSTGSSPLCRLQALSAHFLPWTSDWRIGAELLKWLHEVSAVRLCRHLGCLSADAQLRAISKPERASPRNAVRHRACTRRVPSFDNLSQTWTTDLDDCIQ